MPLPTSPTILLAGASIAMIFGQSLRHAPRWAWGLFFLASMSFASFNLMNDPVAVFATGEGARIESAWNNDGLAQSEQWIVLLFGTLMGVACFDSPRQDRDTHCLYGLLMFALAGLMLVARSNDLLTMGLSLEVTQLAVVAMSKRVRPVWRLNGNQVEIVQENLAHPFWPMFVSSGFLWIGIAILTNAMSTTDFGQLYLGLSQAYGPGIDRDVTSAPSKLVQLGVGLIGMGLFARLGLVPFHSALMGKLGAQTTLLTGFRIQVGQLAASIALTRLLGCVFVGLSHSLTTLLMTVGLATFAMSIVIAMQSLTPGLRSIARLMASLAVFQAAWTGIGLMVISAEMEHPSVRWGVFANQYESLSVLVFIQLLNVLGLGGAMFVFAHLARADRDVEFFEDLKGLGRSRLLPSFALIVALASAVGMPLTAGFWGRWMMLLAGSSVHAKTTSSIYTPHDGLRFMIFTATVSAVFVCVVVIRLAREMFFEWNYSRADTVGGNGPLIAGLIAAIATLTLGIAPQLALGQIRVNPAIRSANPINPKRGSGKNSVSHQHPQQIPPRY